MSRWDAVEEWLAGLDAHLHLVPDLSSAGARAALAVARAEALQARHVLDRSAPAHTVFVASSTVFTVALEWAAVLLGRGGRVTLKAPRGLQAWYAAMADSTPLPLEATTDRAVLASADRIVLMGSDDTVAAVHASLPHPERLLAFGSRHSVAWWTDPDSASRLALDLVLYDGRGCMSPTAVYSPLPDAAELLDDAIRRVRFALPLGTVHPAEAAWIRERSALAKVLGRVVGRVLELPAEHARARATPGVAVLHPVATLDEVPLPSMGISVLGTDADVAPSGIRTVPLGRMQRPTLQRLHDGVPWLDVV